MTRVSVCLVLLSALIVTSRAEAELIEFQSTGTVVSTKDPDVLPLGQPMVGSYSFESDAVLFIPGAEQGLFRDPNNRDYDVVLNLRVESGDYVLETPANRLEIVNAAVSVKLGGDLPQCMRFGGTMQKDRPAAGKKAGIFQAKNAPALSCRLPQLL